MSIYFIALNDVEIVDNMIWIKILLNKLSDVLIGLRALYTKKIEKLILVTFDKKSKVVFYFDKIMCVSSNQTDYIFQLNNHNVESLESIIIDFLLQIAFPDQHLDIELMLLEKNYKYDCVFEIQE